MENSDVQFETEPYLAECIEHYRNVCQLVVRKVTLGNALEEVRKVLFLTNRKVNALEHLVIPKLEKSIFTVKDALEEREREEFFRLKRTLTNKNAPA